MYEMNKRIQYSEVGQTGRLGIADAINALQNCCALQAEDLGVGISFLSERGMGWYITNWQIAFLADLPKIGEHVTVRTWPYNFKGMFGYRNFDLINEAGQTVLEANSLWVMMNRKEDKAARILPEIIEAHTMDQKIERDWPGRKLPLMDGLSEENRLTVQPLFIDTNRHMNNRYYIEIALGVLPPESRVSFLQAEYKKPALLGDEIRVYSASEGKETQAVLKDEKGGVYAAVEFTLC